MSWTIDYYTSENGKFPEFPVKDFIDSLSPESKAKFIFIADILPSCEIGIAEKRMKDFISRKG